MSSSGPCEIRPVTEGKPIERRNGGERGRERECQEEREREERGGGGRKRGRERERVRKSKQDDGERMRAVPVQKVDETDNLFVRWDDFRSWNGFRQTFRWREEEEG